MQYDMVNQPRHYSKTGLEPIDVIDQWLPLWPWQCGFALANAVKYLARCGLKSALAQDLDKAAWYVKRAMSTGATRASDYSHVASITPHDAVASWESSWPEELREPLSHALGSIGRIIETPEQLGEALAAVEKSAYLAREDVAQVSLYETLVIGSPVRVRYATDSAVSAGDEVTLLDMLDDVPSFKVRTRSGMIRYVEDVGAA